MCDGLDDMGDRRHNGGIIQSITTGIYVTDETQIKQPSRTLRLGLAFIAGLGMILMIIAAGVGVISGEDVDTVSLGLLFGVGVGMLVSGIIAWFAVVRPDTHFDDINQPMYHGHHDEH